ncbi:CaiB/BaiF CoA transferase family protein [Frankia gtarii]|uniref:CaiB/BaiF CoA transferase family protein n=1 Tax=Frankia gtarii TaxID=2950102 RepID=UPI0021BF83B2|nr:CaiB/BaiF CoA-transferase family protein [Frankia gtarii]
MNAQNPTGASGEVGEVGGPLAGIRVLDLSRLQPGAFCTRLLADLGAEVLRVEQPGSGDLLRTIPGAHAAYNHGKRSITLDLRHAAAPGVLRRLAAEADVLVESARPGTMDRAGIGYAQLAAEYPGLVWCSLTGFGQDSPYADRPAHDLSFLGYSGVLSLLAGDGVPATPDLVLAVPLGAMVAVIGILAALRERDRTGHGRLVDTSILDAASWLLSEHVARVHAGEPAGWGPSAGRRAYRCADGRLLTLAAAEPRPWRALCAALDLPDLVDRLYAPAAEQEAMTERLAALFASRPMDEWVTLLAQAAVGPVSTVPDLLHDPHVLARGNLLKLDDGNTVLRGPVRLTGADGDTSASSAAASAVAPGFGADTEAVLTRAGFTQSEIATLRREKVL